MPVVDISGLDPVDLGNVEEHVFELFVNRSVCERGLGFVASKQNVVEVTIGEEDYEIKQSISMLNSSTKSSTTGAVAWKVSPLFCEWILDPQTVFHTLLTTDSVFLELGSGVSGILAVTIGPKVEKFIATDQEHLLRLLDENVVANLPVVSKKKKNRPSYHVKIIEYDWEYADQLIENIQDYLTGLHDKCVIVACDTVYNDFLIPHFVKALVVACEKAGPGCHIIIAQQLRAEAIMEAILKELLNRNFRVWSVPEDLLSSELVKGFAVHYLQYNPDQGR